MRSVTIEKLSSKPSLSSLYFLISSIADNGLRMQFLEWCSRNIQEFSQSYVIDPILMEATKADIFTHYDGIAGRSLALGMLSAMRTEEVKYKGERDLIKVTRVINIIGRIE